MTELAGRLIGGLVDEGIEMSAHAMNAGSRVAEHSAAAVERGGGEVVASTVEHTGEAVEHTSQRVLSAGTHAGTDTVSHVVPRGAEEAERTALKQQIAVQKETTNTARTQTWGSFWRTARTAIGVGGVTVGVPVAVGNLVQTFNNEAEVIGSTIGHGLKGLENTVEHTAHNVGNMLAHTYDGVQNAVGGAVGGANAQTLLLAAGGVFVAYEIYRHL